MTTYVLVPGFWLGGWAWRSVTSALREQGHSVYPVSLTGMGERAHLARADTSLDTHVHDLLNLLRYEELQDVVLVGHSYAGAVVTPSVADQVPELIARLVFVDSGPLPSGMSQSEFAPPDEQARTAALVGDGWQLPAPPWSALLPSLSADSVARLDRLSVPQPWATATTPVRLGEGWRKVARTHVLCSFTPEQIREKASSVPAFANMVEDDWDFRELPGSHWPMFDRPDALAAVLSDISA